MGNDHPAPHRFGGEHTQRNAEEYNCRLIRAVNRLDFEITKYLVQKPHLNLEAFEKGDTALTLAIKKRNLDMVKILVDAGANVTCSGSNGQYMFPLKEAIVRQWPDIVQYLLERGSDVNFTHQSFDGGNIEFPKAAISQTGVGVSDWRTMGKSCAESVADWRPVPPRCIKILDMLVQAGANCDATDPNGQNILHFCCERNHYMAASHLLASTDAGAIRRINAFCNCGESPVMMALTKRHEDLACLLLEHGCDVSVENRSGENLLSQALAYHCTEFIKVLLSMGFDVNKRSKSTGNTALFDVLSRQDRTGVEILMKAGANCNAVNNEGQTPLFMTVRRNDLDMFNLLIGDHHAKCDVSDNKGRNLLHTAAHFGHQGIAESLLGGHLTREPVVDFVNRVDVANKTALYIAVSRGHLSLARALLTNGARVNIVDQFGVSPLYQAVLMGRNDVIEMLLEAGASVDQYNSYGKGPLHAAITYPKLDVGALTLLLQAGANPINLDSFLDFLVESGIFQPDDLLDARLLRRLTSEPKPLKHWCRCVIRSRLPDQKQYGILKVAIDSLDLPSSVKGYLGVQFL